MIFILRFKPFLLIVFIFTGIYTFLSCKKTSKVERVPIQMLYTTIPIDFIGEDKHLSEKAQLLLSGLNGNESKCKHDFILDPILRRADLNIDTSLVTTIERSAIAASTSVRDFKILKEHLKEISIPEKMLQKPTSKSDNLFSIYIKSLNFSTDSIIIYSDRSKADSIEINRKKFKIYSDLNDIRSKLSIILCQNQKASLFILLNPPKVISLNPNEDSIKSPTVKHHIGSKNNTKHIIKKISKNGGILNIIKGSEGCDVCTRFYSAIDNNSLVHEVRERNSTNCCPCGKTVKMNGLDYRMNCEGAPHLEPVK